ncbi:MAG: hypothetical protein J6112_07130 [Clostridia bacterium]|nr:hypothetical protein [Clostridia bacterium]
MLKKLLLRFLCIVFVLCLCACNSNNGALLYSGYSDCPFSGSHELEIELRTKDYEYFWLANTSHTINLYGKKYTGKYYKTIVFPYYRCTVDFYTYRENDKIALEFGINRFTKNLTYFFLLGDYPCDTDKNSGKTREECRQIAIQKLYEYDNDITFTEKEIQDDYLNNMYNFMFVKTIEGVETSARFSVSVNTDGVIILMNSDDMPSFDNLGYKEQKLKSIDETNLNEQIEEKLSDILEEPKYEKWELIGRTLHILKDGSPCIEYKIRVVLDTYEVEVEGSIEKVVDDVYFLFIKML